MDSEIKIKLTKEHIEKLKNAATEAGFDSVEKYISYVIDQILDRLENKVKKTLTTEEQEKIKDNLRKMGYL